MMSYWGGARLEFDRRITDFALFSVFFKEKIAILLFRVYLLPVFAAFSSELTRKRIGRAREVNKKLPK